MTTRLIRRFKRQVKLALTLTHRPWTTTKRLAIDLQRLGVRPGGILLVHSSLKSLGFVVGGAHAVVSALQSVLGGTGTLTMPTHTWELVSGGVREFDVRNTPSCVGAVSEVFRTMDGVTRSLHPTHSVAAWGHEAEWLTEGHERASTPCGIGTPYARLIESNGQILFLGCRLDRNTTFHTLEAMAAVPYLLQDAEDMFELIDSTGRRQRIRCRRHRDMVGRRFLEMEPMLADGGALQSGMVGDANCLLVDSTRMCDLLLPLMKRHPQILLPAQIAPDAIPSESSNSG